MIRNTVRVRLFLAKVEQYRQLLAEIKGECFHKQQMAVAKKQTNCWAGTLLCYKSRADRGKILAEQADFLCEISLPIARAVCCIQMKAWKHTGKFLEEIDLKFRRMDELFPQNHENYVICEMVADSVVDLYTFLCVNNYA